MRITNTTGGGALTAGNGILVVDALSGGTTVPGAFRLAGPAVAGPYEYALFRSSVDASNPQAWYLRSATDCSHAGGLPRHLQAAPTEPPPPGRRHQANATYPPPSPVPNYRAETSLYAAIPSMALLYGRNLLDTLHERIGEEEDQRFRANPENAKLGWGRISGSAACSRAKVLVCFVVRPARTFPIVSSALQAGMDVYRHERPDGSRDHAGALFCDRRRSGPGHPLHWQEGDSNFAAYSLGGYWTHFGSSGWYVDTILQGTFYDINSSANRGLPTFKTGVREPLPQLRADTVQVRRWVLHRTAGATGLSEHQHQRHQRHRRTNPLFGCQLARGADRRSVWPDMGDRRQFAHHHRMDTPKPVE